MSTVGLSTLHDQISNLAKEKERVETQLASLRAEVEQLETVLRSKQAELTQSAATMAEQEEILGGYDALISQATANASQMGQLSLELSVLLRHELKRVSA